MPDNNTIVLYPSPGIGHIVSMVELGKLILKSHRHITTTTTTFSVSILLTSGHMDSPTVTSYMQSTSKSYPSISFLRLPPLTVDPSPPRSHAAMAFEFLRLNAPNVHHYLNQISQTSTIKALVIDLFCTSALPLARSLNIPVYYFYTSGAGALAAFLYFPTVFDQYNNSAKRISFKDCDVGTLIHFPAGLPPLKATQMPEPTLDMNDPAYDDMYYFCTHLAKADGILVNTFEELEPKALHALSSGECVPNGPTPPVYCIGPLIGDQTASSHGDNPGETHDCLSWLDTQPKKSVVFLCFGSRGTFSAKQIKEMAIGLEKSGCRFLWVVKSPNTTPLKDPVGTTAFRDGLELEGLLPEGFLKRTKERGMVVKSWAPQVAVLGKEAIGCFVTHCGWNSILEAVMAGVPTVAWPLYAEQHLNRNLMVEFMEMAIRVEQRDGDGLVSADELERALRLLMESEKGS